LFCLTRAQRRGLLAQSIERAASPNEPHEAFGVVRRLFDVFGDRLHLERVFHGRAIDKLVNRGVMALAERLEVPVVSTKAVRFARAEVALSSAVLTAIRGGIRSDGTQS
jgi:DNA polymerase III alpha subunit